MRGCSLIMVPQETDHHQDAISAPEHFPSSCTSYQSFNDIDDAGFTVAPITSMGDLTDLTSYTYAVSIRND